MESATDSLIKQMEVIQAKIDDNSKKMKGFDDKLKVLLSSGGTKREMITELKKKKLLTAQNSKLEVQVNSLMNAAVNMETKAVVKNNEKFISDTAQLQRQISLDPTKANPRHYKSRRELNKDEKSDPEIKDQRVITNKRESMRLKGKDPGPWTSDMSIGEQEQRSVGQDEDLEEAVVARIGAKKKNKSKKLKKSKKYRSLRPRSRISSRRRRR